MQSGSAFSPGVFSYSDTQTNTSKEVAIKFGCITADQWVQHDASLMARMLQVFFFVMPKAVLMWVWSEHVTYDRIRVLINNYDERHSSAKKFRNFRNRLISLSAIRRRLWYLILSLLLSVLWATHFYFKNSAAIALIWDCHVPSYYHDNILVLAITIGRRSTDGNSGKMGSGTRSKRLSWCAWKTNGAASSNSSSNWKL